MKRLTLPGALLYAAFAAAAAALNLGVQWAVVHLWPWPHGTLAALAAGTAAGLVLKYVLDKRWIFGVRAPGLRHELGRFLLYTATGIATTGLFWGVELAFIAVLGTPWARYAGGGIGLCLGYASKYALDRRFVFRAPGSGGQGLSGANAQRRATR